MSTDSGGEKRSIFRFPFGDKRGGNHEAWEVVRLPSQMQKECDHLSAAILRKYIRPVADSLDIEKRIGWHTFRRTYSTLLRSVVAEFKVMQELMRHFTLRTTMDVYTQAVAPAKHTAQAAVLARFFPMTGCVDEDVIVGTG
jgi:site-specific recombinase XerD